MGTQLRGFIHVRVFAGFTIQNCLSKFGAAIDAVGATPRLWDMVFAGNIAQLSGGAIYFSGSNGRVTDVQVGLAL